MENKDQDCLLKILLVGDYYVGKTRFLKTLTNEPFDDITTIGIDFGTKIFNIDNRTIKAIIWDTCGMERYRRNAHSFYKFANAFIVFFDVTRIETFRQLDSMITDIQENNTNAPIIIVGLKCDLNNRAVPTEEASEFAKKYNFKYYEISALKTKQVNEIMIEYLTFYINNRITYANDQLAPVDAIPIDQIETEDIDEYSLESFD